MQFSLPSLLKEDSALQKLYVEICELMKKIHRNDCEPMELKVFADAWLVLLTVCIYCYTINYYNSKEEVLEVDFSTKGVFQIQKLNAILMCIWLCTYYEYYQKNVSLVLYKIIMLSLYACR